MSLWTAFKDRPFSQLQIFVIFGIGKHDNVEKLQINVGETLGINKTVHTE